MTRAIVVRPRPSLWRRFFSRFDRREKAELIGMVSHLQRSLVEAEKRNAQLLEQFAFLSIALRKASVDLEGAKRIIRAASQGLVSMAELEAAVVRLRSA